MKLYKNFKVKPIHVKFDEKVQNERKEQQWNCTKITKYIQNKVVRHEKIGIIVQENKIDEYYAKENILRKQKCQKLQLRKLWNCTKIKKNKAKLRKRSLNEVMN